jgi:hypothetical protein
MQATVDRHASSDWYVVPDVMDTFGAPGRVVGFAQSATRRHIGRRRGLAVLSRLPEGNAVSVPLVKRGDFMSLEKSYTDVPDTTVFDADQARKGYDLNQFCMSLMNSEN